MQFWFQKTSKIYNFEVVLVWYNFDLKIFYYLNKNLVSCNIF